MIRAVVVREAGGPWYLERAELAEPGPGQVRLAVAAVGLCRTDVSLARGGLPAAFPLVPGHEGVATVLRVGPGVEGYAPGDRVLLLWTAPCGSCWYCRHGEQHLCDRQGGDAGPAGNTGPAGNEGPTVTLADGAGAYPALGLGAFADEIVASVASVRKLPVALPDVQAAVLGCAVATGFGAVRNTARVAPDEAVVVVGAGGVGLSVIQTARDVGANPVIAVDPVAERRTLAQRLGAHAAYPPSLGLGRLVREATGGRGADHVFECVGRAATIRQAWGLARRGGQVLVVGAGENADRLQFSAFELFHSARTLRGCVHGSFQPERDLPLLCARAAAGAYDLADLVGRPMGLQRIDEALDALDHGHGARSVFVPAMTEAVAAGEEARA
jgi:S-(hydroxymethyl)glutathione dehydrogenase / alcohol dehydrogenase